MTKPSFSVAAWAMLLVMSSAVVPALGRGYVTDENVLIPTSEGAQVSAFVVRPRARQEHYRRRPQAEHYLAIGPYDHFGTQAASKPAVLRGYSIDPVAQLDTFDLTFDWFDFVFKAVKKPQLLTDLDRAVVLYEVMPGGKYFHLSYTLQRASYAADMSRRQLLTPGRVETIRLDNTLLVSRQLHRHSRLAVAF